MNKYERCWECGTQNKKMGRCRKCQIAVYCSKPCAKSGWSSHRTFCKNVDLDWLVGSVNRYLLYWRNCELCGVYSHFEYLNNSYLCKNCRACAYPDPPISKCQMFSEYDDHTCRKGTQFYKCHSSFCELTLCSREAHLYMHRNRSYNSLTGKHFIFYTCIECAEYKLTRKFFESSSVLRKRWIEILDCNYQETGFPKNLLDIIIDYCLFLVKKQDLLCLK